MERKHKLRSILAFMLSFAMILGAVPLPGNTIVAQAEETIYNGYTATAGTPSVDDDEGYAKLVDGTNAKWCIENFTNAFIEFHSAEQITPNGYILTTGWDSRYSPGRNPTGWTVKAKANENDTEWTTLATVMDDTVLQDENNANYRFGLNNSTAYQYFRLEINSIKSGNVFQLGEFRFISGVDLYHDLSKGTLTGSMFYKHTGSTITPAYTVKASDGSVLTKDTDYTVEITKDGIPVTEIKDEGDYVLTVTGKEPFSGSLTLDINIDKVGKPITSGTTVLDGDRCGIYSVKENITINSRIEVSGTVELVLGAGATLTASKGIHVPEGAVLTISGTGTLVSNGEKNQAGIGGDGGKSCGTVNITGGTVTVTGGSMGGAGIGGGYGGNGGTVSITGGTVTATGGDNAAGIGAGEEASNHGSLTVGNRVTVLGGNAANSETVIGDYSTNRPRYMIVKRGTDDLANASVSGIKSYYMYTGNAIPLAYAVTYGEELTEGTHYTATLTKDGASAASVQEKGAYTLILTAIDGSGYTGTKEIGFTVGDAVSVTAETAEMLDGVIYKATGNVTVTSRISVSGTAELVLSEGATLTVPKGIQVSTGKGLTISGTGALVINDVDNYSAGIGGGDSGNGGTVIINGGTIIVTGGESAAGIGGGLHGAGGTVTINGGTVTATGGSEAAGIGGGKESGGNGSLVIGTGCVAKGSNNGLSGWTTVSEPGTYRYFRVNQYVTTSYVDTSGTHTVQAIPLNNMMKTLSEEWYVVNDNIDYSSGIVLSEDVNLILANGKTMTVEGTIKSYYDKALTVYGQSEQMGKLTVTPPTTDGSHSGMEGCNLTVESGVVEVNSSTDSTFRTDVPAISGGNLTVNGGEVTINGGLYGGNETKSVTVNGGTLTIDGTCGDYIRGNGITRGNLTVNGGTVTVRSANGDNDSGIWTGTVTVNGGSVEIIGYGCGVGNGSLNLAGGTAKVSVYNDSYGDPTGTAFEDETVTVADGLTYTDGTRSYIGMLNDEQITAIDGKTLYPAYGVITADGIEHGTVTAFPAVFRQDTFAGTNKIVTLTVTPDENYSIGTVSYNDGSDHTITPVNNEYTFTMPEKNVTVSATFAKLLAHSDITIDAIDDQTYTGSAITPALTVKDGDTTLTVDTDYTMAYSNNTNAATKNAANAPTVTITGKGAYSGERTVKFTIKKANADVTAPTVKENLVYTGSAQALVNAGSVIGGTMYYAVTTENTEPIAESYTTSIPTVTNAGTYYVWYKVLGDDNHEDYTAADSIAVRVGKGTDPAVVAGTATVQKGEKTIDLSKYVSGARGTVSYAVSGALEGCSVDGETGVFTSGSTTGTCTVTVTIADSDNCNGKTAQISVSVVDKATGILVVTQLNGVYGGTLAAPSYMRPGTAVSESLLYTGNTKKGETYSSASAPTDAGNYSLGVTYETEDTIYSGSASFTIAPADIGDAVITLADGSLTYTGSEQTKTVSKVELGSTEISESEYEVAGNKGTNAGTYTITVTAKAASNYTGTVTKAFAIEKAEPYIQTAPNASQITYGKALSDSILTGGTVQKSNSDATAVAGAFSWKEPDIKPAVSDSDHTEYEVVFTPSGTDAVNYKSKETKITLTVAKADHEAVTAGQVEVAAGDASEIKVNLKSYMESGASLSSSDRQGDLASSIGDVALTGNELKFKVTGSSLDGKSGTILLNVDSANYKTYTIHVPVTVKAKSTQVVFGEDAGTDTSVSGVSSSTLSDYTDAQTDTSVKVILDVEVKKADSVDSTVKTKIESELEKIFSNVDSTDIKKEFLDMKVTKSVNGGTAQEIKDVGKVLEIEVSYDLTGKYNPVIIREHDGKVLKFTELSARPSAGSYKDGTFYVDRTNNKIYIYTEFFSTYSIAYADTPSCQVTFDNDGVKKQVVVKSGGQVIKPANPTKSGYTFNGWYNGTTAWNFSSDTVSADLTLTAKWTKNSGGGSGGGNGGGSGGGSYSPGKTTSARPAAPALDSKTDASITVKTAAGQVYSIDGGKNWQASGTFTGLSPETEYSIVTKISETSTSYESAVSDALKVTTDKKADASTPTAGPGGTATPTNKPDDTAAPDGTAAPTSEPGNTATPGSTAAPTKQPEETVTPTAAPGSTEKPEETPVPDSTVVPAADRKPAAKGTVFMNAGKTAAYVVTSSDAKHPTVAYKQCRNKKAKKVTIPKTVKIGGVTYTVTSIAANAFKNHKTITKVTIEKTIRTIGKNAFYGCKKLKTVTIGKNVKKIGKKAFYGCGKLKKITVKTKKLILKDVGENAFSGIYIRASVLVPADKRKEYALLFKKRGAGKKIRIKTR